MTKYKLPTGELISVEDAMDLKEAHPEIVLVKVVLPDEIKAKPETKDKYPEERRAFLDSLTPSQEELIRLGLRAIRHNAEKGFYLAEKKNAPEQEEIHISLPREMSLRESLKRFLIWSAGRTCQFDDLKPGEVEKEIENIWAGKVLPSEREMEIKLKERDMLELELSREIEKRYEKKKRQWRDEIEGEIRAEIEKENEKVM